MTLPRFGSKEEAASVQQRLSTAVQTLLSIFTNAAQENFDKHFLLAVNRFVVHVICVCSLLRLV